jgi:hypothetical protein
MRVGLSEDGGKLAAFSQVHRKVSTSRKALQLNRYLHPGTTLRRAIVLFVDEDGDCASTAVLLIAPASRIPKDKNAHFEDIAFLLSLLNSTE